MAKTVYVKVAIRLDDDSDAYETIQECDYSFSGEGILSHEIVEIVDDRDLTIF